MGRNRKQGVVLYYTLVVSALLMMILSLAVNDMQKTVFVNNKLQCETKAYWAAMAGLEFAEQNLQQNINWSLQPTSCQVGNYTISAAPNSIHGVSNDIDGAEFLINFYQSPPDGLKLLKGQNRAVSFNAAATANPATNIGGQTINTYLGSDHKVKFPRPANLYVAVEGRCGAFKSVVEKMYVVRKFASKYSSALYVNSADIRLTGQMIVSDLSGRKPCIVAEKGFSISGFPESPQFGNGPLALQGGTIFTSNPSATIGTATLKTNDESNSTKYNLRVASMSKISKPTIEFPDVPNANHLPAGTYAFLEHPKEFNPYLYAKRLISKTDLDNDSDKGCGSKPVGTLSNKQYDLIYTPEDMHMSLSYSASDSTAAKESDFTMRKYCIARLIPEVKFLIGLYSSVAGTAHDNETRFCTAQEYLTSIPDSDFDAQYPKDPKDLKNKDPKVPTPTGKVNIKPKSASEETYYIIYEKGKDGCEYGDDDDTKKAKYLHNSIVLLYKLQKEFKGDVALTPDRDTGRYYIIKPDGKSVNEDDFKNVPFEVATYSGLAFKLKGSIAIDNGNFVLRTLELQGETQGQDAPATAPNPKVDFSNILHNLFDFISDSLHQKSPEEKAGLVLLNKEKNDPLMDSLKEFDGRTYFGAEFSRASLQLSQDGKKGTSSTSSIASIPALVVPNGAIEICGLVLGSGQLIAKTGNISLEAGGELNSQGENFLALYAGQNIYMKYASALYGQDLMKQGMNQVKSMIPDDVDWDTYNFEPLYQKMINVPDGNGGNRELSFKDLMRCNGYQTDNDDNSSAKEFIKNYSYSAEGSYRTLPPTNFKGLIYAKKNLDIALSKSSSKNADICLEGTIYCDGTMTVSKTHNLVIRYSPDLSQIIVTADPLDDAYGLTEVMFNKF